VIDLYKSIDDETFFLN